MRMGILACAKACVLTPSMLLMASAETLAANRPRRKVDVVFMLVSLSGGG
jgi:hypothetical protein